MQMIIKNFEHFFQKKFFGENYEKKVWKDFQGKKFSQNIIEIEINIK